MKNTTLTDKLASADLILPSLVWIEHNWDEDGDLSYIHLQDETYLLNLRGSCFRVFIIM